MGRADAATVRAWREKNPDRYRGGIRSWKAKNREKVNATQREYEARNREKIRAHQAVSRAVKRGDLVRPDACSECGCDGKPHAHHDDYSRPLDVRWLCPGCHADQHKGAGD